MTTAKLTITLPDGVWIADVTRAYPETTVSVVSAVPQAETGVAVARIRADHLDPVLEAIASHESILDLDVIGRLDGEATIQFTTDKPLLLFSAKASGMPIEFPISITNGEATAEVTGSHERIAQLGRTLHEFGLDFDVVYVREYSHPQFGLSDRQRELLVSAVELGYYDAPRRITLTELAAEHDIAKSTCSEILHRAEGTIITKFVSELPEGRAIAQVVEAAGD